MTKKIDLEMLAVDLAEVLSGEEEYGLDVDSTDVLRGLVSFLDTIAPGALTDAQRIGKSL